jgi:beta-glucosidase
MMSLRQLDSAVGSRRFFFVVVSVTFVLSPILHVRADDFDAKARKIVSQMSLEEKISQMHGTRTKDVYRIVVGVPRLGIPDLLVTNGPAGMGPAGPGHQGNATALPAPIGLAATWDVDAAHEYGVIEGSESIDRGNTLLEAPDINIARIPQNGRTFEAYGEDPFLVARLAVANIAGIQSQGIIANVKHFAANNQEQDRGSVNAEIDERTLREIYLSAFEASVKEGHVASLMGAYNRLNGTYCCENNVLLNQILKKEWNFDGFVTSDFGAVHSTVPSVMSGLDVEMPDGKFLGDPLKKAIDDGKVPVAVIDECLVRRFRTMMRMGVWDHLPAQKPIPANENGAVARRLAEEGTVLLRNQDNLLPLKAESLKSVALIGPYASHASTGGGGSSHVEPIYRVDPLEGLQRRLGDGVKITLNDGKDTVAATAAATTADVAIVMVGDQQEEGRDHSLSLTGTQNALVEAVAAANKRTVVVLKSGGPILMPWSDKVSAIVEAWYPGEEDGTAVAAILLGDYNPSGKLPITFPKLLDDVPAHRPEQYPGIGPKNHTVASYSEGVFVGYRWYDAKNIAPLYPFGYGLSYTTFDYRNLKLSDETLSASAPRLTIDFDIANTGNRAGAEVAQVYVGLPSLPDVPQPPYQLKGFTRLMIDPSKTGHAQVTLDARAFSYWDVATHDWKVAPGEYPIYVGSSSRDLHLTAKVTLH